MSHQNNELISSNRETQSICTNQSETNYKWYFDIKYLIVGILFGIVLIKAEVINWFRIQEMFRFQSFHMYGIIGSAVVVGLVSVWLIKKFDIRTLDGEKIVFHTKKFHKGNIFGGVLFGLGWAMTGACPGPLFAQLGSGMWVVGITILSAIFGTWVYGKFREKLPH
ncbi:MAG TPA: YeeE/YedE thiosulfate transporter family protein [Bacteroidia bacterium]|nr:YeeE/YedE thiosulfate transporter family protein [Bacteroidia bacterium]